MCYFFLHFGGRQGVGDTLKSLGEFLAFSLHSTPYKTGLTYV